MRLNDQYLGRITPDEAREAHSNAERDREHMPSAAWRALHAVGQMRYEYAVQVQMSDGEWHFTDDEWYPFGTLEPRHVEWHTKTGAEELYASFVEDDGPKHIRVVRRLVGESEVVE